MTEREEWMALEIAKLQKKLTAYEDAVAYAEKVFKPNKERSWVIRILKEQIAKGLEG